MLIEPQGIRNLDGEHRRQLGRTGLRRKRPARHALRSTLAGMLVTWAGRLAPEAPEPALLRTRAAPS
ncbi:MAG: hypothetical protein HKO63_05565 [Acidimicrobiia bacterium]|nr:hypothetical protein [Acidimicrobiia bacterium]MBT8192739.1 hypothetical protein [Acidimicrobiia bacterium]MBT8246325.1 hypothetical protein [Acidimicrobiia bacterium]NNF89167.1 hypothetical protein [Acidimicrobiia bacterium]NNJ47670.1 hypothetical protein [Acidimicrobiia bacterium]